MSSVVSHRVQRFPISCTLANPADETTIQVISNSGYPSGSKYRCKVEIMRVTFTQTAGTAASATPYILDDTGKAATSPDNVWQGANTASGARLDDISAGGRLAQCDANGRLYFCPNGQGPGTVTGTGYVWLRIHE